MRNIIIETLQQTPIEKQQIELVERKGIGHPDSISDGVAESVSHALCNIYRKRCGRVLHHNTDETQIVAGRSIPKFGGGEVLQPIYLLSVGRATKQFNDISFPTEAVAVEAARTYLKETVPNLDVNRDVIVDVKMGEGSSDLRDVYGREIPGANDTSFGVGHAPFSEVEKIVYNTERKLLTDLKKRLPAIGEDIKVMGLRNGDEITLTVACAMVDRYVDDMNAYVSIKEQMLDYIQDFATRYTNRSVTACLNTADDIESGSIYLTVTGTSCEMGDDGSVGRGNRCNGLITPNRPMSMEATSGKNPINHVGKLYNLLSTKIANDIVEQVKGINELYIRILSQIGKPIDQPLIASAQVVPHDGLGTELSGDQKQDIAAIMDKWLANITQITDMVTTGRLSTF